MGLTYLVDTNILSEPVRQSPHPNVIHRLQAAEDSIAMAATTWHELLFGVLRLPPSQRRTALEKYLFETIAETVEVLPYDATAAGWFAQERARLSKIGLNPAYADGQIAAVAVTNGLVLVTRNVTDFSQFDGLPVENWFNATRPDKS